MLCAIPRLSYLNEAIPLFANAVANILSELLVIIGLFPSRSVGPEPAMINAIGTGSGADGNIKVPSIFPVSVFKVSGNSV